MIGIATTRQAEAADAEALAVLHAAAWRYAYRGIIPGVALERMIARRGPVWWARWPYSQDSTLLIEFAGRIAGYASFGLSRTGGRRRIGEIFELYVEPACHGTGFGRLLFETARARLATRGLSELLVWALADNAQARGFYTAMGGRACLRATRRIGGRPLALIGYRWP